MEKIESPDVLIIEVKGEADPLWSSTMAHQLSTSSISGTAAAGRPRSCSFRSRFAARRGCGCDAARKAGFSGPG